MGMIMTDEQFQAERDRADLSVRAFAELIGMRPNSVSNYARNSVVPAHLAIIITFMAELSVRAFDFRSVIEYLDIARKRPRGAARNSDCRNDFKSEVGRQGRLDLS